jgi:hypothetical protein
MPWLRHNLSLVERVVDQECMDMVGVAEEEV